MVDRSGRLEAGRLSLATTGGRTARAALFGKRLVTASELNEAVRLNEARLKMLAGEDPVTARFLHGEFFTFVPRAKFWLSVNHKPIVNDDSTGFWRKVRLIPFTQSFEGRASKDLKDVLRSEYHGILTWMVRGCLEWQKRGLEPPKVVRSATLAYRAKSDPLAAFLRERCLIGAGYTAKASALYREYVAWADEAELKERERLSNTRFGRLMVERFKKKGRSSGNFYEGIGLRGDDRPAVTPAVEGLLSDDPPFPDSSLGDAVIGEKWNDPPQPSTGYDRLSGDPPPDPPSALHDPPPGGSACNGWRFWSVAGSEAKPKKASNNQAKAKNNPNGLISRLEDGRYFCNACMEAFEAPAGVEPQGCPKGHTPEDFEMA